MVFFSVETWVFVDVNQLIPWFSQGFLTCSDREGSLIAEWRAKTYQNTAFLILFISSRWRITLLKQWGLCELSEIAEIISIVIKRNGFQVVYLFDCMKSREPWTNCQGTQIQGTKDVTQTRDKGFLWTEVVFENELCYLQIYLSFFMLWSNRILN